MLHQVEGFGLSLKMSLRTTIPFVGGSGKLQKDMGNYMLAGVLNLSISHSQNTENLQCWSVHANDSPLGGYSKLQKDMGNRILPGVPKPIDFSFAER